MKLAGRLEEHHPGHWRPMSVAELMAIPGMAAREAWDAETLEADVRQCFLTALRAFVDSRRQEGQQLSQVIEQRAAQLALLVDRARQMLPLHLLSNEKNSATSHRSARGANESGRYD